MGCLRPGPGLKMLSLRTPKASRSPRACPTAAAQVSCVCWDDCVPLSEGCQQEPGKGAARPSHRRPRCSLLGPSESCCARALPDLASSTI